MGGASCSVQTGCIANGQLAAYKGTGPELTNGIDTEIPYQTGGTLLDSVLAHPDLKGVPHSCREGHCGSCMSILKTGKVRMTANRVLSRRDIAAGYVLPCQSIPLTETVWIDFDE